MAMYIWYFHIVIIIYLLSEWHLIEDAKCSSVVGDKDANFLCKRYVDTFLFTAAEGTLSSINYIYIPLICNSKYVWIET